MSLKKDSFNSIDKKYMKLAINLARNQEGFTGNNPPVGCVIVKNNEIVSYGVTSYNGRPHAETIALKKNKKKNIGSTVYLSLEPCSHYGKTPPCTKALIKSGVKSVIFSIKDSDDRSHNKAKQILGSKNILTKSGLLYNEAKKFYKSYNYSKLKKFPYIIGKIACSSDYYIARNNSSITNEYSRKISHLLRFKNQGIFFEQIVVSERSSKLNKKK